MPEKVRTSVRIREDAVEKLESYQDRKALNNRSAAVQHMIFQVDDDADNQQSPFQFWTRLNEALTAAVMSLTVAAVAGAALAALLDAPWLASWGTSAIQAATIGFVALIGTVIQQARVRRREEGISYGEQIRDMAATTTSSKQQEATNS